MHSRSDSRQLQRICQLTRIHTVTFFMSYHGRASAYALLFLYVAPCKKERLSIVMECNEMISKSYRPLRAAAFGNGRRLKPKGAQSPL